MKLTFPRKEFLDAPSLYPRGQTKLPNWFGCLASGLEYIHSNYIRHADIKPANILVSSSSGILFADFGISRELTDAATTTASVSPMTPMYAAPEVANHQRHGRKADIFSLGLVFLEMCLVMFETPVSLFHANIFKSKKRPRHTSEVEQSHLQATYHAHLLEIGDWISFLRHVVDSGDHRKLLEICQNMLDPDPGNRPKAESLVKELPAQFGCPAAMSSHPAAQGFKAEKSAIDPGVRKEISFALKTPAATTLSDIIMNLMHFLLYFSILKDSMKHVVPLLSSKQPSRTLFLLLLTNLVGLESLRAILVDIRDSLGRQMSFTGDRQMTRLAQILRDLGKELKATELPPLAVSSMDMLSRSLNKRRISAGVTILDSYKNQLSKAVKSIKA